MEYIIIFLICFLLLCFLDAVLEEKKLQTVHYELSTDKKLPKTKIVILSDLHNKQYPNKNEKLLKQIQEYQPDLILISGDMITKHETIFNSAGHMLCTKLAQDYPIYYVFGNHEQICELDNPKEMQKYQEDLQEKGITFMNNKAVRLPNGIRISGLVLPLECYHRWKHKKIEKEELMQMLDIQNTEDYHILLCHTPEHMKEYIIYQPDLVVSGHYHGGLIRLPVIGGVITPQFDLFPKYNGGKYQYKQTDIIVSRGLGNHKIKLRFLNKPELIFVTVNS